MRKNWFDLEFSLYKKYENGNILRFTVQTFFKKIKINDL